MSLFNGKPLTVEETGRRRQGRATKPVSVEMKCSRVTAYNYKVQGEDVLDEKGNYDPAKVNAVYDRKQAEQAERMNGSERTDDLDQRIKLARAIKLERENEIEAGNLMTRDEHIQEVVARELEFRNQLLALDYMLAPKLVGKTIPEIEELLRSEHEKVLTVLARHPAIQAQREGEGMPQAVNS